MRILYFDVDCLRPDHLGCYGYHRETSPNIDALASAGVRFENVYCSDAPCLPSRSALFTQRFGVSTGVVNHGGRRASPYSDGPDRGFSDMVGRTSWMRAFRDAGYYTASVSPFGERHAAWHFYAGFREQLNPGRRGLEIADEIAAPAIDWLRRRGTEDNWFLHVNFWDPHTPYRVPAAEGDPFKSSPLPAWYSEEVRQAHWQRTGPHSAREVMGYTDESERWSALYPRQPFVLDSMEQARRLFDGYDLGVLYADRFIGDILKLLEELGVRDDTAILVSGDHGENLGELNVYGDHQTADQFTCRLPAIVVVPGVTDSQAGRVDDALHYQFDVGATLVELAGGKPFENWDSVPFTEAFRGGATAGRKHLALSQAAWACQRSVRMRKNGSDWLWLKSTHDAYHGWPEEMLFNLSDDPHEQRDLHASEPELCTTAGTLLDDWLAENLDGTSHGDPMEEVMAEGGPKHVRGMLPDYLERLRATDRTTIADALAKRGDTQVGALPR